MNISKVILLVFSSALLAHTHLHGVEYKAVPDWLKLPEGRTNIGNMHGDVAVSSKGEVYLRVMDPKAGLQVYATGFDREGKYLNSFGGKKAPYTSNTLHRIAIDTRFEPARIIGCDRANGRVVHMSLDGDFIGVVASGLRLPAAVAIYGDYAAI